MKKFLTIFLVLLITFGVFTPIVFSDSIVPSIGFKDDIEIKEEGTIKEKNPETGVETSITLTPTEKTFTVYERVKDSITGEWDYKKDTQGNKIPKQIDGHNETYEIQVLKAEEQSDDECWVEIVVTPYTYKETIESNLSYRLINECYDKVITTPKIEELDKEDIDAAAAKAHCKVEDLFVTDIFDITKYHRGSKEINSHEVGENHDEDWDEFKGFVAVTLDMKSLRNFVCLLHMNHEGVWDVVDSAKVKNDGKSLYLDVSELSPFAVVVHDEEGVHGRDDDSPSTGVIGSHYGEKQCYMHLYMIINSIIAFAIANIVRYKDEDDEETINKKFKARYITVVLSMILDIIFYILGGCFLCMVALAIELINVGAIVYYTYKNELNEE